jgi:Zn-dependent M28 family amino/carboxypeptidase
LLGSRAYVNKLNATGELYRVALNLNFDMLGSPNYKTGVYNGTDQDKQEDEAVYGSSYIMELFTAYFDSQLFPWTPSAFTGRSDYGPFLGKIFTVAPFSFFSRQNCPLLCAP